MDNTYNWSYGDAGGAGRSNQNAWNSPAWFQNQNQSYGTGGANPLIPILEGAQAGTWSGIGQSSAFANGLEGQRENNINQMLGYLSPGGIQSQLGQVKNGIMQNATQAGQQGAMALKGMGYGDGAAGGAMAGALQQGQNAANSATQQMLSPQNYASVLGAANSVIGQGMQNPLANIAMSYENPIMGQNQFNVATQGQGLLGSLAPILGAATGQGGFLSNLFGSGSGPSMGYSGVGNSSQYSSPVGPVDPSSYWNYYMAQNPNGYY